jgi:uncharacterized Fe-S cluster-containing radical SAM superfamily protein
MSEEKNKLGNILTRKTYIKVRRILSCDKGIDRTLDSLRELYNEPKVHKRIVRKGWSPEVLARCTLTSFKK